MILCPVACQTGQGQRSQGQRKQPLPQFRTGIVDIPLGTGRRNRADRRGCHAHAGINRRNVGLHGGGHGQVKPCRTPLFQQRPQRARKHLTQTMGHKPETDGLFAGCHHPLCTRLLDLRHRPGNGRIIKEEQHGGVRPHLAFHPHEHIAQHRPEQPGPLEQGAQFKGLDGMILERILCGIKEAFVLAVPGKPLQHRAHRRVQGHKPFQVQIRMGNTLGINTPGFGMEFGPPRLLGHDGQEGAQGPLRRRHLRQLEQRTPHIGLDLPRPGHLVLVQQVEEPLQHQPPTVWVVDLRKGGEAQLGAPQVMPLPAQEIGEQPAMPVQVKQLGLCLGILYPLRPQKIPQGALAAAGGPEHQEMPDISHMVDDAKEGGLLRMGVEPRQAVQVGVPLGAGPRRRESGAQMRQGEGMLRRAPHIVEPVARMTRQPRRGRMLPLSGRDESLAIERLHDQFQLVLGHLWVRIPHGHGTGKLAIGHDIRPNFLAGRIGVFGLIGGVGVQDPRRLVGQAFGQPRKQGALLPHPGPLRLAQNTGLDMLFEPHPPGTPTVIDGGRIQGPHHPDRRLGGIGHHRTRAHMPVAQLGIPAPNQRRITELHINITEHRQPGHGVPAIRDAGVQIGQGLFGGEGPTDRQHALEQIHQIIRLGHKLPE